mmetsp:Transcript_29187/g.44936  ORF Transcript_29187/g.44936 Transcript_29187/m.44936 type:complete len:90 (-) Transcript_29187:91-360(-)
MNGTPWKRTKAQYRSAIFFTTISQQDEALHFLQQVRDTDNKRLFVEVVLAGTFYQAEAYHQDYMLRRQMQGKQAECLSNVCVPVWKTQK